MRLFAQRKLPEVAHIEQVLVELFEFDAALNLLLRPVVLRDGCHSRRENSEDFSGGDGASVR